MCKKVSVLFLRSQRPTLKLTSCWSRLLWCSGIDAENGEFAKVASWDYDLFSHSDRTLGWINSRGPHRPHQEPFDTPPSLRIPTNGWIFEAQKICTVVVCTHCSVRNCPSAAELVQALSHHPPKPERLPRFGNHNDPTPGPPHPHQSVSQVIEVGGFEAAMFCSAAPRCHVVSPRLTQRCCCPSRTPRLGLAGAGDWRKKPRKWKSKAVL